MARANDGSPHGRARAEVSRRPQRAPRTDAATARHVPPPRAPAGPTTRRPDSATPTAAAPAWTGSRTGSRAGRAQYSDLSGWDQYRAQFQLLALLRPRVAGDFAQSLHTFARQNGGVRNRRVHVDGPTHVMTGVPSAATPAGFLFPHAEIERPGRDIVLDAPAAAAGHAYVGGVRLDGRTHDQSWADGSLLREGGTPRYSLTPEPDTRWATAPAGVPR